MRRISSLLFFEEECNITNCCDASGETLFPAVVVDNGWVEVELVRVRSDDDDDDDLDWILLLQQQQHLLKEMD